MPNIVIKEVAVWLIEDIGGNKGVTCSNCQHRDAQLLSVLNGCMHYCPYCGAEIVARVEKKYNKTKLTDSVEMPLMPTNRPTNFNNRVYPEDFWKKVLDRDAIKNYEQPVLVYDTLDNEWDSTPPDVTHTLGVLVDVDFERNIAVVKPVNNLVKTILEEAILLPLGSGTLEYHPLEKTICAIDYKLEGFTALSKKDWEKGECPRHDGVTEKVVLE